MASKTPSKLEIHRLIRHRDGHTGSLLTLIELEQDDHEMIVHELFSEMRNCDDPYSAYSRILPSWGVMCPHPQSKILYSGKVKSDLPLPATEHRWFDCSCCGATVMNFLPDQQQRKAGGG